MNNRASHILTIKNKRALVSVDLYGGAIVDFHLLDKPINPLSFKYPAGKMPANNKAGQVYQGHFICAGRWGPPSKEEIKAGHPDHGQAANILWTALNNDDDDKEINMEVEAPLDGLYITRELCLDDNNAVFKVTEEIKNINYQGRIYNIVQHPTISKPFLTNNTVVNCNATHGFNYKMSTDPFANAGEWPYGLTEGMDTVNLSVPDKHYSSVFSFIVEKDAKIGWITAFSPEHKLMIGYLWMRKQYPWINLWQDFDGKNIRYRGLEFGTTGMHKPYPQILAENNHHVFGEGTYKHIDAGKTQKCGYMAFIYKTPVNFQSVTNVGLKEGIITITGTNKQQINIQTSFTDGF